MGFFGLHACIMWMSQASITWSSVYIECIDDCAFFQAQIVPKINSWDSALFFGLKSEVVSFYSSAKDQEGRASFSVVLMYRATNYICTLIFPHQFDAAALLDDELIGRSFKSVFDFGHGGCSTWFLFLAAHLSSNPLFGVKMTARTHCSFYPFLFFRSCLLTVELT